MILITHDGNAHCDDLTAYAILKEIFERRGEEVYLIRTRDQRVIDIDQPKVVFDVGMKFDDKTFFDHHQNEKELRQDGVPYSSAGLIWRNAGREFVRLYASEYVDEIFHEIDEKFIRDIDIGDNGVKTEDTKYLTHRHSFSRLISSDVTSIKEFEDTAAVIHRILVHMVKSIEVRLNEKLKLANLIKADYDGNGVLVSDEPIENLPPSIEPSIMFVVHPKQDSTDWYIKTIRLNSNSFDNRKQLWYKAGGLVDKELEKETGIPGMKFCHSALFLAVAKTKEAAVAFAKLSMENE